MPRVVNFMDAARMTAQTSRETALRVRQYFGDAGPFSWAFNASFMRKLLEDVYEDYFNESRFWLADAEVNEEGERQLKLIDLHSVAPMSEREFT